MRRPGFSRDDAILTGIGNTCWESIGGLDGGGIALQGRPPGRQVAELPFLVGGHVRSAGDAIM